MIDMDRREQPFGKHDMLTKMLTQHNGGGRGKGIEKYIKNRPFKSFTKHIRKNLKNSSPKGRKYLERVVW